MYRLAWKFIFLKTGIYGKLYIISSVYGIEFELTFLLFIHSILIYYSMTKPKMPSSYFKLVDPVMTCHLGNLTVL